MSVEVVQLRDNRIYLIIGNPDHGYDIHPAADPVAHYQHKYDARHAINHGELELSDDSGAEPVEPSETGSGVLPTQPGGRRLRAMTSPPATSTPTEQPGTP